jgi:hypothetical protein
MTDSGAMGWQVSIDVAQDFAGSEQTVQGGILLYDQRGRHAVEAASVMGGIQRRNQVRRVSFKV